MTLYLHVSPAVLNQAAFRARAAAIGGISGFAYLGVETASLAEALGAHLDRAVIPSVPRARAVEMLLGGILSVFVPAGQVIGAASPRATEPQEREVGFACLTGRGTIDPSYTYDLMRDFVEGGQAAVDGLLGLAPKRWPVLDASLDEAAALSHTRDAVYPFSVLEELRDRFALSAAKWRQVGDNQKRLYREMLLRRVGHAPPGSTAPPFEFNDRDWQNIFQIEAIVEFYSLFPDPWARDAVPIDPQPATAVDLLDPAGEAATAAGNVVTLDGNAALSSVRRGDLIHLAADTARPKKWYRIAEVDAVHRRVTLEARPGEPGVGAAGSPWRIRVRPALICIDAFGGRCHGTSARRTGANTLTLDGAPDLRKVNARFDTIYLADDHARPRRTYRIIAFDSGRHTVTLDGDPDLRGGATPWHVPAGLSGELPALDYELGPSEHQTRPDPRLYDHYDGVMFVVHDGKVHRKVRFTSYTSRDHAAGSGVLSSIRGNRRYHVASYTSPPAGNEPGPRFRNFCFAVVDPGQISDHVRDARFYFSSPVTRDPDGKTTIRIHRGNMRSRGSGSAGCVVSPVFRELRDVLIERHQENRRALAEPEDADLQRLHRKSDKDAETLWLGRRGGWDNKITATLWVIRPDELALG
ncbi:hypothetical protein BE04_28380 [Sorangium cellulosum]|uniref:Uncharacterized protein n=1 Tax=Sorangium cellulosum TaxID=56 RepID=A0A150PPF3_SORCE|nr:hypothetical protein BE04_28380 [Sorangium cellulosum]